MTEYSTTQNGSATHPELIDAYLAGVQHGIAVGAVMAMAPAEKQRAGYTRRLYEQRRAEGHAVAQRLARDRTRTPGWPDTMPGGWPLPASIPSDDPSTWWPEHNGWPCPPPALRGGTA